jgi:hypothetical protein
VRKIKMAITKRKRKKNLLARFILGVKAFTVAETIIAAAILTFITGAVYGIGASGRRSWEIGDALLRTQQQVRMGLTQMENEMRIAAQVSLTDDASTAAATFSTPIDGNGDGNLDFLPGTSVLVFGAEGVSGQFIEYQIDKLNGQLIRRILDASGNQLQRKIIVPNVNPALSSFQNEAGLSIGTATQTVTISLTVQLDTIQGEPITPSLRTSLIGSVTLRN